MQTILLGVILGFFFGLTGSGGSTLAVPLLVYGMGLGPHRAVCASMISVGALAALRTAQALRSDGVEFRIGCVVALAGMAGAPAGAWGSRMLPEKWLLLIFGGFVGLVAIRMLFQGPAKRNLVSAVEKTGPPLESLEQESQPPSALQASSASLLTLSLIGFVTGSLAGLLGIGGGFVVVPALVFFCGLEIHRAIATSMFTITLISAAAMAAHWFAGQRPPMDTVGLFTCGGLLGLGPGSLLARRLSGRRLEQVFALALFSLAAFILARSLPMNP